jgi:hypothetical protein
MYVYPILNFINENGYGLPGSTNDHSLSHELQCSSCQSDQKPHEGHASLRACW